MTSPWWYRQRGYVMSAIYLVGFFGGQTLWELAGHNRYVPFFQWAGAYLGPQGDNILFGIAVLLTIGCWAIRYWGSGYLNDRVVWNPDAHTHALLVDGPFRYVRNPLYLGNILMALGVGMLATPYGYGIVVLGNVLFVALLGAFEAKGLEAVYGPAYDAYRRAVPALVPRFTPATVEGSVTGTFVRAYGLRSEIFTATAAFGMILLWIFHQRAFALFMILLVLGYAVQNLVARRPIRPSAKPPEP